MQSTSTSLSPSFSYPRLEGSGLGCVGGGQEALPVGVEEPEVADRAEHDPDAAFDAEDVQPQQSLKTPLLPPRAVIEEHRIDHWPPRTWCDECNEGHGRERRHGRVAEEHKFALVSMDYAFYTRGGAIVAEGDEGWNDTEALKMIIVKDSLSKSVFAHAVPQKGIDEKRFAVDSVVADVQWLGYSKLLLKSDNEPAVVKLLKETLAGLKVTGMSVGEEHSPPFDSQANGAAEAAVKQVKTRLRTMKLCLERRIGKRIPPKHPIMAWLVTHVAALLRYRARGADGKTPYEHVRLRPFNTKLLCFGERCSFKVRSKEPLLDEHRFHHGVFLGLCPLTGQYVVHDVERKVVRMARTIKMVPDNMKWRPDDIEAVRVTPYDMHVTASGPGVVFQDRPEQPGDADPARKITVRKLYIKGADIAAFGFTVGCPKCDHDQRYGPGRTTKGHSNAC